MNKKRLLTLIASVVMSAAFCLTGCGGCNNEVPSGPDNDNPPVIEPEKPITTDLIDIEVDASKAKTSYYVGESFSSSRLVVKAVTKRSDRDVTQTLDVSASAKINSNSFRRTRVGEYQIKVSYTLGSVTKEKSYTVTVKEIELSFGLEGVQTSYLVGEDLDIDNLKVYATAIEPGKDPVTEEITASEDLVIDSSAFDKTKEGTYPVKATYSLAGGVLRTATFNVSTVYTKEGFNVSLAAGVSDTINLTATNKTAEIDVSQIVVNPVDAYGVVQEDTVIDINNNDYDNFKIELYNGGEKLSSETNVYTGLTSGTYQIWVTADSKTVEGYTLSGFALIYVVEDVVSGSFKKTSENDTTQNIGVDTMSGNWEYEIRYASDPDTPVVITADQVTVTGIKTLETNSGTAKVTYYYKLANGQTYSQSISVPYTVVKGENQVIETNTYAYAFSDFADKQPLTNDDLTGANSFLSVVGTNVIARPNTDNGIIEYTGDGLEVTYQGVGTLEIKARGAGNSAAAVIGVKRVEDDGTVVYMTATLQPNNSNYTVTELTYPQGKMYEVLGKYDSATTITFVIDKPGTYTIFSIRTNPEDETVYTGATRLYAIQQIDIYDKVV